MSDVTSYLLVLRGHVILPLGPDDALPQVLHSGPLRGGAAQVDQTINLQLRLLSSRQRCNKFLDDIKLSPEVLVLLLASLRQRELKLLPDEVFRGGLEHLSSDWRGAPG